MITFIMPCKVGETAVVLAFLPLQMATLVFGEIRLFGQAVGMTKSTISPVVLASQVYGRNQ